MMHEIYHHKETVVGGRKIMSKKCKFCNGMGQIEIEEYSQGDKLNPDFQLTTRITLEKKLRIDCPKCNGSGK